MSLDRWRVPGSRLLLFFDLPLVTKHESVDLFISYMLGINAARDIHSPHQYYPDIAPRYFLCRASATEYKPQYIVVESLASAPRLPRFLSALAPFPPIRFIPRFCRFFHRFSRYISRKLSPCIPGASALCCVYVRRQTQHMAFCDAGRARRHRPAGAFPGPGRHAVFRLNVPAASEPAAPEEGCWPPTSRRLGGHKVLWLRASGLPSAKARRSAAARLVASG